MSEIDILKKAYEDVIWMAMRYANGRKTYAPSMVRDSIKAFQTVFPDWKPRNDQTLKSDRIDEIEWCKRHGVELSNGYWLDDLVDCDRFGDEENTAQTS